MHETFEHFFAFLPELHFRKSTTEGRVKHAELIKRSKNTISKRGNLSINSGIFYGPFSIVKKKWFVEQKARDFLFKDDHEQAHNLCVN